MASLRPRFTNDVFFKLLFVQHPKLLKNLVANLMGVNVKNLGSFEIRNPEIPPESLGDKFCRLDIAMTVDGKRVSLEIQVGDEGNYEDRALYYWAREFSTALPKGKSYSDLPPTIVISIVDFKLFEAPEFHSEFGPMELTRHTPLTDKMKLVIFELPKIKTPVNAKNSLELWLRLFKAKTEADLARIKEMGVPVMNQAIEAYHSVAVSREFRELERLRSKARHDEAQALHNAERKGEQKGRQEGLREGKQEGLREGLREGKQEGILNVAQNLLGMGSPIDDIMTATGLTREEIEKLRNAH